MTGKTHKITGIAIGLTISNIILKDEPAIHNTVSIFIASYLGSILPDTDILSSTASKHVILTSITNCVLSWLSFGFGDNEYTISLLKHRGISHSVFIIPPFLLISFLIFTLFLRNLKLSFLYWAIAGSLSLLFHILLDSFNQTGVMLIAPFSNKAFSLFKITYNGILESFIRFALLIYILISLIFYIARLIPLL